MQLIEMYSGAVNSPETFITADITATSSEIYVQDVSAIPSAPNLLVIGGNLSNAETVKLISVDGNKLTVQRAFQGIAQAWAAETMIARNFTEYDHDAAMQNIRTLAASLDNALARIAENETKIELLELAFFNDIQSNPFVITFGNLDGLKVEGIWNETLQRIEC